MESCKSLNYNALTSKHHHPYGMMMPNRDWSSESGYRFGFGGQEQVDQIYGDGNLNTALFWEYDTRLGRRWNVDPKPNPSISNYATFINNPILYVDIYGDVPDDYYNEKGIKVYTDNQETDNIRIINQLDFDRAKVSAHFVSKQLGKGINSSEFDKVINEQSLGLNDALKNGYPLESLSNIYTGILTENGFNTNKLHNNKISISNTKNITDPDTGAEYPGVVDDINDQSSTSGSLANTDINKFPGEIVVTANLNNRNTPFITESEVVSFLGVHELVGHGELKLGAGMVDHAKVYTMQKEHSSFNKLSKDHQDMIINRSKK